MKKLIALLLALVMCLSLCACGTSNTSSEDDDKIYLTLDNYDTYLSVDCVRGFRLGVNWDDGPICSYDGVKLGLYAKGRSPNFNYYDITIEARVVFKDRVFWNDDVQNIYVEDTIILDDVDITGNGQVFGKFHDRKVEVGDHSIEMELEVISVSGYVEHA